MPATKEQCDVILTALLGEHPQLIEKWWNSPNKAFDGATPIDMMENDSLRVISYLWNQLNPPYS